MADISAGFASRQLAWEILGDGSGRFKKDLLSEKFMAGTLPAADRRLVTELVNGVVRHAQTLLHIAREYSYRLPKDVQVQNSLMLGLYQLLFMERIPAYAAIDTAVELLKRDHPRQDVSYVNAVLRSIQRDAARLQTPEEAMDVLPCTPGLAWRFNKALFPDPEREKDAYWACVYSYPHELVKRWHMCHGSDLCRELLMAGNTAPPLFLRLRRGVNSDTFAARLAQHNVQCTFYHDLCQIAQSGDITELPGFAEGEFSVSGTAANEVVAALAGKPGQEILDLCAAPGGKTLQIVDQLGGQGHVVACDISADRLKMLENSKQKWSLSCLDIIHCDALHLPEEFHGRFDHVLIDAPCSNTGVLSKRVEARWRFSVAYLRELKAAQSEILQSGARAVKKGGDLLYSTCSLEPEENQEVVQKFLRSHPNFTCSLQKQILPLPPTYDGATFFKLVKK
jgi:16S rRNA (cytosine967-C5)-methyltransferase